MDLVGPTSDERAPVPEQDWGRLVPVKTRYSGDEIVIKKTIVSIGRGEEADVTIKVKGISRIHATIRYNPRLRVYFILDGGSKNGTWMNRRKIVSHDLKGGDEIGFHTEVFRFEWISAREANLDAIE